MNPFTALPPRVRAVIYMTTFALGIGFGAVQLAYDTEGLALPTWLVVALKVLPFLAAGFGITAASNTKVSAARIDSTPAPAVEVQSEPITSPAAKVVDRTPRDKLGRFARRT